MDISVFWKHMQKTTKLFMIFKLLKMNRSWKNRSWSAVKVMANFLILFCIPLPYFILSNPNVSHKVTQLIFHAQNLLFIWTCNIGSNVDQFIINLAHLDFKPVHLHKANQHTPEKQDLLQRKPYPKRMADHISYKLLYSVDIILMLEILNIIKSGCGIVQLILETQRSESLKHLCELT